MKTAIRVCVPVTYHLLNLEDKPQKNNVLDESKKKIQGESTENLALVTGVGE